MSLVLIVIGLIILTVFPALNAVRTSNQRNLTDSNLQMLLRATAVYAQANGCLPCPTPATTTGAGFGRVRGDSAANAAACNGCSVAEGVAPFASLGLPAAMAHDGWGHWITMRVDPALTGGAGTFTPIVPLSGAALTQGLCTANLSTNANALPVLVQIPGGGNSRYAVIFVSHGPNGYGAFVASALAGLTNGSRLPFPAITRSCASGGYEGCNASDTTQFVDATPMTGGNNPFDDTLLYMKRDNIVSLLGNNACQTAW